MTIDEAIAELERLKAVYGGLMPVRVRLRRTDEFGSVLISRTRALDIVCLEVAERIENLSAGTYRRMVTIEVPPVPAND